MTWCMIAMTSCEKLDFNKFVIGNPYTGLYQGKECVIIIDYAEEGNIKGRFYLDNDNMINSPISFSTNLKKNGKGKLWIKDVEKELRKVKVEEGRAEGEIDKMQFSLNLYHEPDLHFNPQFIEPCYEVTVEHSRVYAKNVEGFWSSFPDTGESFVSIYREKISDLLVKEKLDLDMDLYYPKVLVKGNSRPLLVLIHGGAFYNGDKKDIGYPQLGMYFAERGYVVASINYRLGYLPIGSDVNRAGYRALQDAHASICYLIHNANEFGIDTTNIFTAGTSAGAITALNLAFMREENRPDDTREGGTIRWVNSTLSKVRKVIRRVGGYLGFNLDFDYQQALEDLGKDLGLDTDLGPIDLVSDTLSRPFHIKGVVNMWGAVHSLEMLKNSKQTDILSFHGDSDRIVPYIYGFPFDHVFEDAANSIFDKAPKAISDLGRDFIDKGKPFNEWAFTPLHGSSQIHDKAISLGLHSKLLTVYGGIHSLHQVDFETLSVFFYDTILPEMNRFLYETLVGNKPVRLEHAGSWVEALNTDNVDELHWQVDGGVVINGQGEFKKKILLFGDASRHNVIVGGKYKNGIEFCLSIPENELDAK